MVSQIRQETKQLHIKYVNEGNVSKIGWAKLCKFEHGTRDTYAFKKYFYKILSKLKNLLILGKYTDT